MFIKRGILRDRAEEINKSREMEINRERERYLRVHVEKKGRGMIDR